MNEINEPMMVSNEEIMKRCGSNYYSQTLNTTTITSDGFGEPYLINTEVTEERVTLVYRRDPSFTFTGGVHQFNTQQPYPIIYATIVTALGDKLVFTKVPYKYVPPVDESYEIDY